MADLAESPEVATATPDAVEQESTHEEDELGGPEEPLGSQTLRALHEDAKYLLERYDKVHDRLEPDSKVKEHLHGKLESLVDEMEKIESLHGEHYKDLEGVEPLDTGGGDDEEGEGEEEEGTQESEEGDEEPEGGGGGEEEEDEAGGEETQADSHEEEPPSPEESARGMQKEAKRLNGKVRRKSVCPECGKDPCICNKKHLRKRIKAEDVEAKEDEADEDVELNEPEANEEESQEMKLEPHEKEQVDSAKEYLGEVAQTKDFTDAHRMHAFHHHMNLGQIGSKSATGGAIGGAIGGLGGPISGAIGGGIGGSMSMDDEDMEGKAAPAGKKPSFMQRHGGKIAAVGGAVAAGVAGLAAGHAAGYMRGHGQGQRDEHAHQAAARSYSGPPSRPRSKDFPEMDRVIQETEIPDPSSNPQDVPHDEMAPHIQAIMGAHDFLGRLSQEKAFGDPHRHEAAYHYKALDEVSQMQGADEQVDVNEPESNPQDTPEESEDQDIGQIDEKSLKIIMDATKQQQNQIKELAFTLRNVGKL